MRFVGLAAAAYAAGLLALTAIHVLAPQRDGMLAISQIGAPHLFLPLVVLLPLVAIRPRAPILALVLLAALVGLLRFGPGMASLPASPAAHEQTIAVATWNLAAGQVAAELLVERLRDADAEIVALTELRPEHVAALEASDDLAERYPHRLLMPDRSVLGMGLLSAHSFSQRSADTVPPPHILVDVAMPGGQTLVTLAAHPLPPRFGLLGPIPFGYDSFYRDDDLAWLRTLVDDDLAAGRPVLVIGDYNVTDREPGYHDLAAGLRDTHREAGFGPGSTWRPLRLAWLPFAILRIDYVFTGGPVRPVATSVDCTPAGGDHCFLSAVVAMEPP